MSGRKKINCAYCGKENLTRNDIGLNKKLIHFQIKKMRCLTCMAEHLEITEDELEEVIERFKQQGCPLFM